MPDVAGVSPATMLSSVDLPQPEWPMIETNSPLRTVSDTSRNTSVPSAPPKHFPTFSICTKRSLFSMRSSSSARRAARHDAAEHGDRAIEQQADEADVKQRENDVADARAVPRIPDEEPDAHAADQHLAGDD